MKRKLIAVALACALVFSMIPSLAFADVTIAETDGVPSSADLIKLAQEIDAYDYENDLSLTNYADIDEKIVAFDEAVAKLITIEGDSDYSDYTKAQVEAADLEYASVRGFVEKVDDAESLYDDTLVALVATAVAKLEPTDIFANTDGAAKKATNVANLAKAMKTVDSGADGYGAAEEAVKDVEAALFGWMVKDEFTSICDVATEADTNDSNKLKVKTVTVDEKQLIAADVGAVVAAYPQLTTAVDDIKALIDNAKVGGAVASTTVAADSDIIMSIYAKVVEMYNADNVDKFTKAVTVLGTYDPLKEEAAFIAKDKEAREAYAALVMDETTKNASVSMSGLWLQEAKFVDALATAAGLYDATEHEIDELIAATKKARAAYDELTKFYEEAEETGSTSELTAAANKIGAAERAIKGYYEGEIKLTYAKVKDVTEITAENRADVEAFVKAYEVYEENLSIAEKEAIAADEKSDGAAYAAKYAVLKPALDAVIKAEEEQAQADKDALAKLPEMEKELADLKAQKDADAAEIAALEAQIAFLKAKVKNVKATAGKKKATVKWAKLDGAVKYKVFRATSRNGNFKAVKTTTNLRFVNKKLKSGNNYFYKVVAIDANGNQSKDSKIIRTKKIK